jgi:hypothetical protein
MVRFEILSLWTSLRDLMRLDFASCNVMVRTQLFDAINDDFFILKLKKVESEYMMKWVTHRDLLLKQMALISYNFNIKKGLKFNFNFSRLNELEITNCPGTIVPTLVLINVLNSCQRLTSLTIDNVESFTIQCFSRINLVIVKQLTKIQMGSKLKFDSLPVNTLIECVNLRSLTLFISFENLVEKDLISLVERNPKLEIICIHSPESEENAPIFPISDALLVTIINTCEHIQEISFNNCQNISLSVIISVFRKYKEQLILVNISLFRMDFGCVHYSKSYIIHRSVDAQGFDVKLWGNFHSEFPQRDWIQLLSNMTNCRLISFVKCSGISDRVLDCVLNHNVDTLKYLLIGECVHMESESMIVRMKQMIPNLTVSREF